MSYIAEILQTVELMELNQIDEELPRLIADLTAFRNNVVRPHLTNSYVSFKEHGSLSSNSTGTTTPKSLLAKCEQLHNSLTQMHRTVVERSRSKRDGGGSLMQDKLALIETHLPVSEQCLQFCRLHERLTEIDEDYPLNCLSQYDEIERIIGEIKGGGDVIDSWSNIFERIQFVVATDKSEVLTEIDSILRQSIDLTSTNNEKSIAVAKEFTDETIQLLSCLYRTENIMGTQFDRLVKFLNGPFLQEILTKSNNCDLTVTNTTTTDGGHFVVLKLVVVPQPTRTKKTKNENFDFASASSAGATCSFIKPLSTLAKFIKDYLNYELDAVNGFTTFKYIGDELLASIAATTVASPHDLIAITDALQDIFVYDGNEISSPSLILIDSCCQDGADNTEAILHKAKELLRGNLDDLNDDHMVSNHVITIAEMIDQNCHIARALVQLYAQFVPIVHQNLLKTSAKHVAIFHNNAAYLSRQITTTRHLVDSNHLLLHISANLFKEFTETTVAELRRIIEIDAGFGDHNLLKLKLVDEFTATEGAVQHCFDIMDDLQTNWAAILDPVTLAKMLSVVIVAFAQCLVACIQRYTCISRDVAVKLVVVLRNVQRYADQMTERYRLNHSEGIWSQFGELIFLLSAANVVDIKNRYGGGGGGSTGGSSSFNRTELRQLVRALFNYDGECAGKADAILTS